MNSLYQILTLLPSPGNCRENFLPRYLLTISSPSSLARRRRRRRENLLRKGRGRFFSSSPLSRVLPLFLSFRKFFSSSALFSSRDGNCFRRERSFLLPSSAPLSSIFFFLSPSLLSSLFRFLSLSLFSFSLLASRLLATEITSVARESQGSGDGA